MFIIGINWAITAMNTLYVSDTNGLIHFFSEVFEQESQLSPQARSIYEQALLTYPGSVRLSIPGIVFVEIYEKWFTNDEFARRFHFEVSSRIVASPNIEIKPIEREVVEIVMSLEGNLANHEIHDKIILASAMMLECPLITSDQAIIEFNEEFNVLPAIIY